MWKTCILRTQRVCLKSPHDAINHCVHLSERMGGKLSARNRTVCLSRGVSAFSRKHRSQTLDQRPTVMIELDLSGPPSCVLLLAAPLDLHKVNVIRPSLHCTGTFVAQGESVTAACSLHVGHVQRRHDAYALLSGHDRSSSKLLIGRKEQSDGSAHNAGPFVMCLCAVGRALALSAPYYPRSLFFIGTSNSSTARSADGQQHGQYIRATTPYAAPRHGGRPPPPGATSADEPHLRDASVVAQADNV